MSVSSSPSKKFSKSKSQTKPIFSGTDFSSRSGGRISFDPSIRGLQEEGVSSVASGQQRLGEAVGQFGGSMGELRGQLFTNRDPFMQARTRGLEQQQAQERGALQQDIGRRGLGGSSFSQQAQTVQSAAQQTQLSDQRALAVQDSIKTGMTIDEMMLNAEALAAQGDLEQANYLRGIADDRARLEASVLTATGTDSSAKMEAWAHSGSFGMGGGGSSGGGGGL